MVLSDSSTIFSISLASGSNGSRTTIGSGAIGSGGTIEGGGVRASTSAWGLLPIFNLVVEFFGELRQNYQGVKTEKLWSLQDFQCKLHESL